MWSLGLERGCLTGACGWAQVIAGHCWKFCSKSCCHKCLLDQGCAMVAVCPTAPVRNQHSSSVLTIHVQDHWWWPVKPRAFLSWGLDQAHNQSEQAWCCCTAWGLSGRLSREGLQHPCPERFGVFALCREHREHLNPVFQVHSTANQIRLFR